MSSEMLSKVLLQFNDSDLHSIYKREKTEFFTKSMPIVTSMLGVLAMLLEIMYRGAGMGDLPAFISTVNWTSLMMLGIISAFHSKWNFLHYFICPLLTLINYLYISFVDYDYTVGSIYYSLIIGFTISLFVLVIFNESWLASTLTYFPCLTFYMYKTGYDLLGAENQELIMRIFFCVSIYAIIAYRIEILTK